MKIDVRMRAVWIALALAGMAALGGARASLAADGEPLEIFIDARQPAYVTYQSVTADASPQARQEMLGYTGLDDVSLVPWAQFRDNVQDFVARAMVINAYPGQATALGVLAVLKTHPGRPVAVTWNGGVATSFFDFQYAVDSFDAYREDAEGYARAHGENAIDDPLNPTVQIKAMLGQ